MANREITVYTKKVCGKCTVVKNYLIDHGFIIDEINVDDQVGVAEMLKDRNFGSMPIISTGDLDTAFVVNDVSDLDSWLIQKIEGMLHDKT